MSISKPIESSRQGGLPLPTRSLRNPSLIAGGGLLLMIIFSVYGVFGPVDSLTTSGDAARTAADVAGSEMLFRTGIASLTIVVVLDVIVAAALFEVFVSVNRSVSLVAAWFRLAYSAVFLVAVCQLLEVPGLVTEGDEILRAVDSFNIIWHVGLILFAAHLLLIGYLAYRSGFMAKIFGVLLVIAGLGYLADSFGTVLIPDFTPFIAQFVFVGEAALIFWLLIKGRTITAHISVGSKQPQENRVPGAQ